MYKGSFATPKPKTNIAIIGHAGHGKTTLATAIATVCSGTPVSKDFYRIDYAPEERINYQSNFSVLEFESKNRCYNSADFKSYTDCVKRLISSTTQLDGVILIVSAAEPGLALEPVRLLGVIGIQIIVVFLNKVDLINDLEKLKVAEREVRDVLSIYDFPGDDTPIIYGSASMALEGLDDNGQGTSAVKQLVDTLDAFIPDPVLDIDKPFLMPIEKLLTGSGRGTVVTGCVGRGIINLQEEVEIVGPRNTIKANCIELKMVGRLMDQGTAGDNLEVLLRGVQTEDIEPGQLIAKPGSISAYTQFEALVYFLPKEEGGRSTAIPQTYETEFHFHGVDISGICTLNPDLQSLPPGNRSTVSAALIKPTALENGLRFTVREEGQTVGIGVVSKVIEQSFSAPS